MKEHLLPLTPASTLPLALLFLLIYVLNIIYLYVTPLT